LLDFFAEEKINGDQKRVQSKIAAGCLKQAILAADKVNAAIVTYFESDT